MKAKRTIFGGLVAMGLTAAVVATSGSLAGAAVGSATHKITASYSGDSSHGQSQGSTQAQVTAPPLPQAPGTTIKEKPKAKSVERLATFSFASDQADSSFQCKLDKKSFRPCRSPREARVKPGRHSFSVRAVNAQGVADPTPAVFRWWVLEVVPPPDVVDPISRSRAVRKDESHKLSPLSMRTSSGSNHFLRQ